MYKLKWERCVLESDKAGRYSNVPPFPQQTRLICGALNIASCMKSADLGNAAVQAAWTDVLPHISEHDALF
jgi:hypothetical protein